jgi:hypothetical protein
LVVQRTSGALFLFLPTLAGCAAAPSASQPQVHGDLAAAESLYADLRDIRDRIDVTIASGRTGSNDATPAAPSIMGYNRLRRNVAARLAAVDSSALRADDARALGVMRRTLARDLDTLSLPPAHPPAARAPSCSYDVPSIARLNTGLDSLRARIYSCYAWAQSHVVIAGDTLDRLTILASLGRTEDASRRRELFLALDPVWRSMNGDNNATSPYRQLIRQEVRKRNKAESPAAEQARASGVAPDSLEHWLRAMLTTWRDVSRDSLVEPWDWFYQIGRTSRLLSPRISHERLLQVNREVYRSLGADVEELRVQYDVEPREGKTPVAYTTFGARPRLMNGSWRRGEPWVFATYRTGGLDNLNELLHETGHAIHIAAIRTRPAFADWPDSDPFTEAVADFVALEVYEPSWQQHWLGDSVPVTEGLRARYGGIVLDVAWALFELQMQRDTTADPNQVWTGLTRDYLRIRPHPELSWWAMRGQLIDAPGYMMNYAAGAILIAAIRARTRELHGSFTPGDSTWYRWLAPRLYRFGLQRPTRSVIEDFLGGPVSPTAIVQDMRRMSAP